MPISQIEKIRKVKKIMLKPKKNFEIMLKLK